MDPILQAVLACIGITVVFASISWYHDKLPSFKDMIAAAKSDPEKLFIGKADGYSYWAMNTVMTIITTLGLATGFVLAMVYYHIGDDLDKNWWLKISLLNLDYVTDFNYLIFGIFNLIAFFSVFVSRKFITKNNAYRSRFIEIRDTLIFYGKPLNGRTVEDFLDNIGAAGKYTELTIDDIVRNGNIDSFNDIDYTLTTNTFNNAFDDDDEDDEDSDDDESDDNSKNEEDYYVDALETQTDDYGGNYNSNKKRYRNWSYNFGHHDCDRDCIKSSCHDAGKIIRKKVRAVYRKMTKIFKNRKLPYKFFKFNDQHTVSFLTKNPLEHDNHDFTTEFVPHIYNINMNNLNLKNKNRLTLSKILFFVLACLWIPYSSFVNYAASQSDAVLDDASLGGASPLIAGFVMLFSSSIIPIVLQYNAENFENMNDHGDVQTSIFKKYTFFNVAFVVSSAGLSHYILRVDDLWSNTISFCYHAIDSIPFSGKLYTCIILYKIFIANMMELFGINDIILEYMYEYGYVDSKVRVISYGSECSVVVLMSFLFFLLNFNIPALTLVIWLYFVFTNFTHKYRYYTNKNNISLKGNTNGDLYDTFYHFTMNTLFFCDCFMFVYFLVDFYEAHDYEVAHFKYDAYAHPLFLTVLSLIVLSQVIADNKSLVKLKKPFTEDIALSKK